MAAHSSVLAWRIPGTGEPGGLLSMGSQSQTRLIHAFGFVKCTLLSCQMQAARMEMVFWALSRDKDSSVLHLEISLGITHQQKHREGALSGALCIKIRVWL